MVIIHQVVTICIYIWGFAVVSASAFVSYLVLPLTWIFCLLICELVWLFFVCLPIPWIFSWMWSSEKPLGSSSFSAPVCVFMLQHLIHISKFYFCFHGENSFFHFPWDTEMHHCAWSSRTQGKISCHFLSLKNGRPGAGRCNLILLYGELYLRDQWHVRNLPALSAEMYFGFRMYICYVHKCFPSLVSNLCIHFSSGTRNYSRFSSCL